jgi:hypothetical protein
MIRMTNRGGKSIVIRDGRRERHAIALRRESGKIRSIERSKSELTQEND